MKASFEKGDSNRCRNAYEKILHQELDRSLLEPHKKNKHISVRARGCGVIKGLGRQCGQRGAV